MEISRWLFNPFYYVAGAKALVIGVSNIMVGMLVMAINIPLVYNKVR